MIPHKSASPCQGLVLYLTCLTLADGSPYFPRQPSLPDSVFMSLVRTENAQWQENQLIKDFIGLATKSYSSKNSSWDSENEDFMEKQLHFQYFEGDIIGVTTSWTQNGRVIF